MPSTARFFRSMLGMLSLLLATPLLTQVAVSVTPKGDTETARNQYTGGYSATFRVTNETPDRGTTQFQITCNSHWPVVCDSIRTTTLALNNGAGFANVTAYYGVGTAGTGQLVGRATAGAVSEHRNKREPNEILAPAECTKQRGPVSGLRGLSRHRVRPRAALTLIPIQTCPVRASPPASPSSETR